MSKSLNNFYTVRDLLERKIDPKDVRYSMLSSHYGSIYNFTFDGIKAARKGRLRIQEYIYNLFGATEGNLDANVEKLEEAVFSELANDLHTPKALGALFSFINNNPANKLSDGAKLLLKDFFNKLNRIFSVWDVTEPKSSEENIPVDIIQLAERRRTAKMNKDWSSADNIRKEILDAGYEIKDAKEGYTITRLNQG